MTKLQELVELFKKIQAENFYGVIFKEVYEIMSNQLNLLLPPLEFLYLRVLPEEEWHRFVMTLSGKLTIADTGSMTRHHKLLPNGRMVYCEGHYVLSVNENKIMRHAHKSDSQLSNCIWNYVIVLAHELLHIVDEYAEDTLEGELRLHRKEVEVAEKFLEFSLTNEYKKQRENEICKLLKKKFIECTGR